MNLGCLKAHMDDEKCTPWLELIVPCLNWISILLTNSQLCK